MCLHMFGTEADDKRRHNLPIMEITGNQRYDAGRQISYIHTVKFSEEYVERICLCRSTLAQVSDVLVYSLQA